MSINADGSSTILIYMDGAVVKYKKDGSEMGPVPWPATIVNDTATSSTTKLTVLFDDITLNDVGGGTTKYFVCGSGRIQFGNRSLRANGTRPIITVDGITAYPGLIRNGTVGVNGRDEIYICNLTVNGLNGANLDGEGGWIGQTYFGRGASNNMVINCSSNGTIDEKSGGILGSYTGSSNGTVVCIHCNSTGNIAGNAGGIVGAYARDGGGSVQCEECFSSGPISGVAGGIFGSNADGTIALECYSKGPIGSTGCGGIYGQSARNAAGAINCYSEGAIGSGAGGIFGKDAMNTSASRCYSIGDIQDGGGIYGSGTDSKLASATLCYTSGFSTNIGSGGIYAGSNDDVPANNNYSEANNGSSGWNYNNAAPRLSSTIWFNPNPTLVQTPFYLIGFGYSLYTPDIITPDYGIVKQYPETVTAGDSTNSAIVTGYTFKGFQTEPTIQINLNTGQITTSPLTPPGTYDFYVLGQINPYHHIRVTLTVNAPPSPPPPAPAVTVSCCPTDKDLAGLPYETSTQAAAGKALIVERNQNPRVKFKTHADYMTYLKTMALRR